MKFSRIVGHALVIAFACTACGSQSSVSQTTPATSGLSTSTTDPQSCFVGGCVAPSDPIAQRGSQTSVSRTTPATSALSPSTTGPQSCFVGGCVAPPDAIAQTGQWAPATGNLAGLPTGCAGLNLVSSKPNQDLVIAGVVNQGLWASPTGSATWTRLGQGAGSAPITNRPSSITYDPIQSGTFWENGTYGSGAYETTDNGNTFKQLGSLINSDLVSVDLGDPARLTLLSGKHESSGLFKSSNGGLTWADLSLTLPRGVGHTSAPLVLDREDFLLGTTDGTASGIFQSTDGGATWSKVYPVAIAGPPLVASDGAIYWVLADDKGLIKSTDRGATWQYVTKISSLSGDLIQLPNGWLATIGQWVSVSRDHGVTWTGIGPPLPYLPTGFTYSASGKAFYVWQSVCQEKGSQTINADAIMRMPANLPAH